ncbi:MAG: hypothetical protein ACNFW9_02105 [Candidatus Kerfeldbacteria bacterium]
MGKTIGIIAFVIGIGLVLSGCGINISDDKDQGCCMPFCSETDQDACVNTHGGTWNKSSCSNIEQCQTGCCTPQCTEDTKEMCDQFGGTYNNTTCDQIEQCQTECCVPFCTELSQVECEQRAGTSKPGKCEDLEECNKGCCAPFNEQLSETECEMRAGEWHKDGCPGYQASMSDEAVYDIEGTPMTASHELTFTAHTCGESIDSEWTGTWYWIWTIVGESGTNTDDASETITFTPDSSGSFTFSMGEFGTVTGSVNESNMSISFTAPGIVGLVEASGPVKQGTDISCLEE